MNESPNSDAPAPAGAPEIKTEHRRRGAGDPQRCYPSAMSKSASKRDLTSEERHLVRWMLEHGAPDAPQFLPQLQRAQVFHTRCPCGCASIDFSIDGQPKPGGGLRPLADFVFGSGDELSGIFDFEQSGVPAGLEVHGLAGEAPKTLPSPDSLRPLADDQIRAVDKSRLVKRLGKLDATVAVAVLDTLGELLRHVATAHQQTWLRLVTLTPTFTDEDSHHAPDSRRGR